MSRPLLDEAQLILIAAAASATTPAEVLASADVAALARVSAEIEACDDVLEVAAAALVGLAKERPFGADSKAVAWLACALIAPVEAARVAVSPADTIDLVGRAACGEATREHVREQLASRQTRCPACRRTIGADIPARPAPPSFRGTQVELVARCAVENRGHGRYGQPFPEPATVVDTPWRPVVANDETGAMIVLADTVPLLLLPDGERYVVAEATFVAGDLVGDWRSLIDHALVRTSVTADAIALDADGSRIDWSRLDQVLRPTHATA